MSCCCCGSTKNMRRTWRTKILPLCSYSCRLRSSHISMVLLSCFLAPGCWLVFAFTRDSVVIKSDSSGVGSRHASENPASAFQVVSVPDIMIAHSSGGSVDFWNTAYYCCLWKRTSYDWGGCGGIPLGGIVQRYTVGSCSIMRPGDFSWHSIASGSSTFWERVLESSIRSSTSGHQTVLNGLRCVQQIIPSSFALIQGFLWHPVNWRIDKIV